MFKIPFQKGEARVRILASTETISTALPCSSLSIPSLNSSVGVVELRPEMQLEIREKWIKDLSQVSVKGERLKLSVLSDGETLPLKRRSGKCSPPPLYEVKLKGRTYSVQKGIRLHLFYPVPRSAQQLFFLKKRGELLYRFAKKRSLWDNTIEVVIVEKGEEIQIIKRERRKG
jgi:hypothetical protein